MIADHERDRAHDRVALRYDLATQRIRRHPADAVGSLLPRAMLVRYHILHTRAATGAFDADAIAAVAIRLGRAVDRQLLRPQDRGIGEPDPHLELITHVHLEQCEGQREPVVPPRAGELAAPHRAPGQHLIAVADIDHIEHRDHLVIDRDGIHKEINDVGLLPGGHHLSQHGVQVYKPLDCAIPS